MLYTKKFVRISPEIDWYSYQWPQDGKMRYVTAVLVKIHLFLIVPSAGPLCSVPGLKSKGFPIWTIVTLVLFWYSLALKVTFFLNP